MDGNEILEKLKGKESRDNRQLLDEAADTIRRLMSENITLKKRILARYRKANSRERGCWIASEYSCGDLVYECSICHEPWTLNGGTPIDNLMFFCPHCGARMDMEVKVCGNDL